MEQNNTVRVPEMKFASDSLTHSVSSHRMAVVENTSEGFELLPYLLKSHKT